jgi:hypothetical protein
MAKDKKNTVTRGTHVRTGKTIKYKAVKGPAVPKGQGQAFREYMANR